MSSEFLKFDTEKNRLELIEPEFIEGIGKILTYGAEKYEAWNWRKIDSQEDLDRIKGATLRHMMAYMKGEKNDPETNLSHLYHMGCNLMFLDYFDRNGLREHPNVMEDVERPKKLKITASATVDKDDANMLSTEEALKKKVNYNLMGTKWTFAWMDADGGFVIGNSTNTLGEMVSFNDYLSFKDWLKVAKQS